MWIVHVDSDYFVMNCAAPIFFFFSCSLPKFLHIAPLIKRCQYRYFSTNCQQHRSYNKHHGGAFLLDKKKTFTFNIQYTFVDNTHTFIKLTFSERLLLVAELWYSSSAT